MKKKNIIIILILLMIISIVNNYYARYLVTSYSNYFIKQLIWYLLGFIIIFIISKLNINFIYKYSFYGYLLGNFLLVLTLVFGKSINGAKLWLSIGFFSFQPSEFMKIFLIIYLYYLTINYKLSDIKYLLLTLLLILIPSVFTFLEPDTGGVLFYVVVWFSFICLKKLKKRYYFIIFGSLLIGLGSFLLLYYGFQDLFIKIFGSSFFYRMDRITEFIKKDGYQINTALQSISNSGLWGLKNKLYFPESTTDFAFSLLISNIGIIGVVIFIIIYSLLFRELFNCKCNKYLKYSVIMILLCQYIINILMNIGLFPIMGITLPFLSYGGSSLISYFILIGLLIRNSH